MRTERKTEEREREREGEREGEIFDVCVPSFSCLPFDLLLNF
jgi:hypothetical protein